MYWAEWENNKIRRANLDGSIVQDVLLPFSNPRGIDIDPIDGKIYWGEISGGIRRASLNGLNIEVLHGEIRDEELTLDLLNEKIYWISPGGRNLLRANLDMSNIETVLGSLGRQPFDIALDIPPVIPEPSSITVWLVAVGLLTRRRKDYPRGLAS